MKTIFAKECTDFMMNQDEEMIASSLKIFMDQKFFSKQAKYSFNDNINQIISDSSKLKVYKEKLIGALIGKLDNDKNCKINFFFYFIRLFILYSLMKMLYKFFKIIIYSVGR